uniref:Lipopolysaccharide transport system ATP-binding protein n=1 Tax=Candidatus Kentrum sp. UNK TaxID=2126344 RepID=A0A451AY54_9GAMM|nr:MAG: lipopolysaccharide transport system ATP-binding protein [Candidatus Kentron sp. UNK]VFK70968.1 MAG: lipopolysaccharide transport system ATP-binding protein [Candidatus Kentron sp. UNK]
MTVLSVQDIGKAFRSYRSEWHRFARWFGLPLKPTEETWVLRHIGFDIQPGEAIGIVGQNGAGKSTLLKIITGTLQPNEGQVQVNGRIAAILELGMGFNPDLTGRQNVHHAAGLMGFTSEHIQETMPNIEAFAEIGEYFDEPVRTYSSGMQVRVAFAVATAWRPEILIVDEALSVGDAYFQHKSFNRICEFQEQGTTLLIVSHDRNAIQTLCDRAILLEKGAVIGDGDPEEVFDYYNALIAEKGIGTIEVETLDSGKTQTRSGTGEARVEEIALYNSQGEVAEYVEVGERVEIRVRVKVYEAVDMLVLGYGIKDRLGQMMYGTNTWHTKQVIDHPGVGEEYQFMINFPANFGVGSYSIVTALHDTDTHLGTNYEWCDLTLVFNVINTNKKHFAGCNWLESGIMVKAL